MEEKEIHHLVEDKLREHLHPLTKEDFTQVKAVIEHHGRIRWLWSSIKVWILAAMTVITFFTVGIDGVKTILKRLVS